MKRLFSLLILLGIGALGWNYFRTSPNANNANWTQLARQFEKQLEHTAERSRLALAAPTPSGQQLSRYEKLLCDLANLERSKRRLPPLQIVPALADVARGHSREMSQKNYFSHTSPTASRRNPLDRYVLKYQRQPRLIAENIYKLQTSGFYKLTEQDFRRAHEGWMKSPGHRANILRTEPAGGPTQIGVGIVVKDGSFWATQNFARP